MRRLYFLTKEKESAETISHDLHDAGVADWNYKVVSRHKTGIYKQHVHSADMIQTSKFLISAERGALIGIGVVCYSPSYCHCYLFNMAFCLLVL